MPPGWKVQVTGVRVVAPAPEGNDKLRAFNWFPGVTVALLVTAPEKSIISVSKDRSKITSFTDDKGTDLLAPEAGTVDYSSWFNSDSAAEKSVSAEVKASGQPAKGATQFNLAGTLSVETASQNTNITAENVELKAGSEFTVGRIKFTMSGVRLQGKDFVVTLQAKQDLAAISHLDFYGTNGTKIESHKYSSSSWGFAGEHADFFVREGHQAQRYVLVRGMAFHALVVGEKHNPFAVRRGVREPIVEIV